MTWSRVNEDITRADFVRSKRSFLYLAGELGLRPPDIPGMVNWMMFSVSNCYVSLARDY